MSHIRDPCKEHRKIKEHKSLWKLSNVYMKLLLKISFKSAVLLVTPTLHVL